MKFDESLKEIQIQSSILTASIRKLKIEPNLHDKKTILEQIDFIQLILVQDWFQNEINENVYHFENFDKFEFFISFFENILTFIENFGEQQTLNHLQVLKKISTLKITIFLKIKSQLLIRFLRLLENNNVESEIVLTVLIELSENQFLGNIDYDSSYVWSLLNEFQVKYPSHSNFLTKIVYNLNKKSIEDILFQFKECFDENGNIKFAKSKLNANKLKKKFFQKHIPFLNSEKIDYD